MIFNSKMSAVVELVGAVLRWSSSPSLSIRCASWRRSCRSWRWLYFIHCGASGFGLTLSNPVPIPAVSTYALIMAQVAPPFNRRWVCLSLGGIGSGVFSEVFWCFGCQHRDCWKWLLGWWCPWFGLVSGFVQWCEMVVEGCWSSPACLSGGLGLHVWPGLVNPVWVAPLRDCSCLVTACGVFGQSCVSWGVCVFSWHRTSSGVDVTVCKEGVVHALLSVQICMVKGRVERDEWLHVLQLQVCGGRWCCTWIQLSRRSRCG